MKGGNKPARRRLSAGTVFMLILIIAVLGGSAAVLGRLSSGASIDLSRLNMNVLDLRNDVSPDTEEDPPAKKQDAEKRPVQQSVIESAADQPVWPVAEPEFSLTFGGSISLTGEVRKNSRSTDAKVADYADVMMLLAPQIRSDVNGVFFENILSDRNKTADNIAPAQAAVLIREAGFNVAACGFSQAYSCGRDGIESTLMTLDRQEISTLGIRYADDPGIPEIRTVNGIKTAFLQYTSTVSAKTRKTMVRDETDGMVPEADPDQITQDVGLARQYGAEAVVVLLSWGKTGSNTPDKAQRELAGKTAEAGADLIIGCGSHVPQAAEYLPGKNGRTVLCVWSLGTLLSGDRGNIRRMSGYLLHVTVRRDGQGGVQILNPEYTPVYTWKYKQDGRFYYRCIAAGGGAPDGMDSDQRKTMTKAAETVGTILNGSPLRERGKADAP